MASAPAKTIPSAKTSKLSVAVSLIAGSVVILSVAEIAAWAGLPRVSRIERRIDREIAEAASIHRVPNAAPKVLIVGNSLLLRGVDFQNLKGSLAPGIEVRRLVVEGTNYLDWYYGLRKLFAEGARPDVVVLNINAPQLITDAFRGDYSAYRLVSMGDLTHLARDAGLNLTQTTSLFFARSSFFGTRVEIRKFLLSSLMPGFQELQGHLTQPREWKFDPEFIVMHASQRLASLRALSQEYGATFIYLIPAELKPSTDDQALEEAGRQVSVQVLRPLAPGEAPAREFMDGFHLNPQGAARYTTALSPLLKRVVRVSRNQLAKTQ